MTCDVVVGFSINPEIVWTDISGDKPGQKSPAKAAFAISGTSFDVVLALKACNCQPALIGAVGKEDPFNGLLEAHLRKLDIIHVLLPAREHTCLASIEPNSGRHLSFKSPVIVVDEGRVSEFVSSTQPKFGIVTALMPDLNEVKLAQALLRSVAGKRILNPRQALMEERGLLKEVIEATDWLFLNRFEAAAYLETKPSEVTFTKLQQFLELGLEMVIVTQDGDGALAVASDGWQCDLPAFIPSGEGQSGVKINDKGAGDCFLGFFVGALLKGYNKQEAFQLARIAAGIKVLRLGTTNIPTLEEVFCAYTQWHDFEV